MKRKSSFLHYLLFLYIINIQPDMSGIQLFPLFFPTSSQCLIQIDYSLYLLKPVTHLCQLGGQQSLLGGENFKISGISMLHEQLCAGNSRLQGRDLTLVKTGLIPGCLILLQSVVHFSTSIEQDLRERQLRFFLLCFSYSKTGYILPFIK